MKEIRQSIVVTKYQAVDGTIFDCKEECQKYDNTAKAVISSKFNKLIKGKYNAFDLVGGYEDNDICVVKITSDADADVVLSMYYLNNPYILKEGNKELKEKFENMVNEAKTTGSPLLMGLNSEGELYLLNTAAYYIAQLTNL